MDDLRSEVLDFGKRARAAARVLARMSTEWKNAALLAMADQLHASAGTILRANGKDVEKATADQLSLPMIDRLRLDEKRIQGMADGIREVAALEDPAGKVIAEWTRPNGLHISKVRVPIGVIGIIYESRPNVTSDAAVLCTKRRLGIDSLERRHCRSAPRRRSQRGLARRQCFAHSKDWSRCRASHGRDGPIYRSHCSAWRPGIDRNSG